MFSSSWGAFRPSALQFISRNLQRQSRSKRNDVRSFSSSGTAGATQRSGGFLSNPVVKAGLISGSLSLLGDLVAQGLVNFNKDTTSPSYDANRAFRMGTFGLALYGPYQHFWYRALDKALPARTVTNFALKVFLNQAALAPLVVGGVFAWTLGLQGKVDEWPAKMKRDFVPTLTTGWKFWVPAASINFVAIPLQHQVLYMSVCGVVWTAFLSYSSAISAQEQETKPSKKSK